MKGVNRATVALGHDLIVYTGGEYPRASRADRERRWRRRRCHCRHTDRYKLLHDSPVVVVDPNIETHTYPAVIATNRDGTLAAMEYLIGLGHRRIGFISGRPDLQSAARRLQGSKDGLTRAGILLDPELIQARDFTRQTGYVCAQRLLNLADPPTAIFASNDWSAIGAIKAIHEAGLRIPDAAYTHPGLTTVDRSIDEMGHIAIGRMQSGADVRGRSVGHGLGS